MGEPARYSRKFAVLERGLGGVSGESLTARGDKATTTIYDMRLGPYLGEVQEKGWVIDKYELLHNSPRAIDLVLDCPLLDLSLAAGQREQCPEPSDILLVGLQGSFQALAVMKRARPQWQGLDSVDLAKYVQYWLEAGARIGQREGQYVWWAGEERILIPPYQERYTTRMEIDDLVR